MATSLIILNEEWHLIIFDYFNSLGKYIFIFFMIILVLGDLLLMKMFTALFINNSLNSLKIKRILNKRKFRISTITKYYHLFHEKIFQMFNNFFKNKKKKPLKTPNIKIEVIENSNNSLPESQRDVTDYNFPSSHSKLNSTKGLFSKINKNSRFEIAIFLSIFSSSILLILKSPLEDPNSNLSTIFLYAEFGVVIFYFIELMIKIYSFGNKTKKFRIGNFFENYWNFFDCIIFIASILGIINNAFFKFTNFQFSLIRIVRIFKIIQYFHSIKSAVITLEKSLNALFKLGLFFILILLFFGCIGVDYLKGEFFFCEGLFYNS